MSKRKWIYLCSWVEGMGKTENPMEDFGQQAKWQINAFADSNGLLSLDIFYLGSKGSVRFPLVLSKEIGRFIEELTP